MRPVRIIAAVDYHGGFARNGKIPWHFKEDFQHFKNITKGHICVMGRKTYEDMLRMILDREDARIKKIVAKEKQRCEEWGVEYTPSMTKKLPRINVPAILPGRESFVLTRNTNAIFAGATAITSLRQAASIAPKNKHIFVIGGERLFNEAIVWTSNVYLTVVKGYYQCDRFFPVNYLNKKFRIINGRETEELYFVEYKRQINT